MSIIHRGFGRQRRHVSPQKPLHATCIPLDGLVEMNLGSWEGSNWRVIERENSPEYQEWRKDRRYVRTPGGGECYNDVVKRTLDAMEYIMKRENGDVLIVTHSAIIMALRCYIAGLPFDEMVRKFKTRNAEVVMIESFKIIDAIARFKKKINKSQQKTQKLLYREKQVNQSSLCSSFFVTENYVAMFLLHNQRGISLSNAALVTSAQF